MEGHNIFLFIINYYIRLEKEILPAQYELNDRTMNNAVTSDTNVGFFEVFAALTVIQQYKRCIP